MFPNISFEHEQVHSLVVAGYMQQCRFCRIGLSIFPIISSCGLAIWHYSASFMVSISSVYPYLDVEKLFQLPFFTLQVMNRKLAATNIAENQATDGKESLQKPEAIGEENDVVENSVAWGFQGLCEIKF